MGACRDEPAGLVAYLGGHSEAADDSDIMASYGAERAQIRSDKSLSKADRKSRMAQAKRRMQLQRLARKANRELTKIRPMRIIKPRPPPGPTP